MKNQLNALLLTAALSGLVGGTTVAAQGANQGTAKSKGNRGQGRACAIPARTKPAKHSCKGKNSCKGQGGCKSGDNGCKGKNSCSGKGGCATDGSKMPKAV